MHDTLQYVCRDPVHSRFHQNELTFRGLYAFTENFMLPLSHDEVVHGKQSLLSKMPGDDWQKFANLRLLFGCQFGQPGKKLLFMGGEFGQWHEWNYDDSLDWHLTQWERHSGMQRWVADLNRAYRNESALHEMDCNPTGFAWVDCSDSDTSILSFLRSGHGDEIIVAAFNFTPVPRLYYKIGVPADGYWKEILNSDATEYGGSGMGNQGGVWAADHWWHGRPHTLYLTLPPLGVVFLKRG